MRLMQLILGLMIAMPLWCGPALAGVVQKVENGPYTYVISHSHRLGNNDSYNEARAMCLQEIKREALERVGSFMLVESGSQNFQLTSDQVSGLSAAFVRTTVLSESYEKDEAGAMVLTLTAQAVVDPESVDACLRVLREGNGTADAPSQPLDAAASPDARPADPAPSAVFAPGAAPSPDLPGAAGQAFDPLMERERIEALIESETEAVERYVVKDMTVAEVEAVAGAPRVASPEGLDGEGYVCQRHGRLWVVYRHGLVACVRRNLTPAAGAEGLCHCAGLSTSFVLR